MQARPKDWEVTEIDGKKMLCMDGVWYPYKSTIIDLENPIDKVNTDHVKEGDILIRTSTRESFQYIDGQWVAI